MMRSKEIRQAFFDFFESKGHTIVPSAPIVVKNDPTLMFTNAGMNQFKDYFLGNGTPPNPRIADSQKCLRVSGKHNDLEEVGVDSYHHTMFEMLGNWSIGDYFKKEAIEWAWELLTKVYKLPEDRLYASYFGGESSESLNPDEEAKELWSQFLPKDRILAFDKKDNFWEMGDTGPCGPCSEIHVDLRPEAERITTNGSILVNADHPLVIEVWNLVFIQYNRKADGSLESLPAKHVDTGMGFERLTMAMQSKTSNYDTDIFGDYISLISKETDTKYTGSYAPDAKSDIAMRVISDHIRAICFAIADGQMPSNNGAGYVIRRILRRAVRYYYSFLDRKEPLLHLLVAQLAAFFKDVFPEVQAQEKFVTKVILEEEKSFLNTLSSGLKRFNQLETSGGLIDGKDAFELYDTFGFPIDLTRLIASEKGLEVDEQGFESAINEQKERGRADAKRSTGDWVVVRADIEIEFVGYDLLEVDGIELIKYRTVKEKDKEIKQLVISKTPFYAEGGGQVGDTGVINIGAEQIKVLDTKKENDLILHIVDKFPKQLKEIATAKVDHKRRALIEKNHSATHLLHAALRDTLGTHVQQKGSLVKEDYLRFDFSHFNKISEEDLSTIEGMVNDKLRENISLKEDRAISIDAAKEAGAMMLFGEKYGDSVRMITFDPSFSRELCGGCHVDATGQIGLFKLKSESGIAAGVRRIEALTGPGAESYVNAQLKELRDTKDLFKSNLAVPQIVQNLIEENKKLKKEMEQLSADKASGLKDTLKAKVEDINGIQLIAESVQISDSKAAKTLVHNLISEIENGVILLGIDTGEKVQLMLIIDKKLVQDGNLHAGKMIKELASHIRGGGGGQDYFATAGGSLKEGIPLAIESIKTML